MWTGLESGQSAVTGSTVATGYHITKSPQQSEVTSCIWLHLRALAKISTSHQTLGNSFTCPEKNFIPCLVVNAWSRLHRVSAAAPVAGANDWVSQSENGVHFGVEMHGVSRGSDSLRDGVKNAVASPILSRIWSSASYVEFQSLPGEPNVFEMSHRVPPLLMCRTKSAGSHSSQGKQRGISKYRKYSRVSTGPSIPKAAQAPATSSYVLQEVKDFPLLRHACGD